LALQKPLSAESLCIAASGEKSDPAPAGGE
jgi:hypothetical protein